MLRSCWCIFLTSMLFLTQCSGDAVMKIRLQYYNNNGGKDSQGDDCDFFDKCDTEFEFCVQSFGNCDLFFIETDAYEDEDDVVFQDGELLPGTFSTNLLEMYLPNYKVTGYQFKIRTDHDDIAFDALIDNLEALITDVDFPYASEAELQWVDFVANGKRVDDPTSLNFQAAVYCKPNYSGATCENFTCEEDRDDDGGHYTCSGGDVVCLSGWENPDRKCLDRMSTTTTTTTRPAPTDGDCLLWGIGCEDDGDDDEDGDDEYGDDEYEYGDDEDGDDENDTKLEWWAYLAIVGGIVLVILLACCCYYCNCGCKCGGCENCCACNCCPDCRCPKCDCCPSCDCNCPKCCDTCMECGCCPSCPSCDDCCSCCPRLDCCGACDYGLCPECKDGRVYCCFGLYCTCHD